jgi:hypothetical protein
MHRHYRDLYGIPIPNTYSHKLIDPSASENLFYESLYDSVPVSATNGSLDTTHYVINSSSVTFTNGYLDLGTIQLENNWTLDGWFYLTTDVTPIFSINGIFSIEYDQSNSEFVIKRTLYDSTSETRYLSCTLALNEWHFISFVRNFNILSLYVDLVSVVNIDNFYYPIADGQAYVGKVASNTFTGNLSNIRLLNQALYPVLNTEIVEGIKHPYFESNNSNKYEIIHLKDKEYCNGGLIYPFSNINNTFYDYLNSRWTISPSSINTSWFTGSNGLVLTLDPGIEIPIYYTLEFSFSLPVNVSSNVVLYAQWQSSVYRGYYFLYDNIDGKIKFVYYKPELNTIETVIVGNYVPNSTNYIALQRISSGFEIYLNGARTVTSSYALGKPLSHTHRFNTNVNNVVGNSNLYLYEFILSNLKKYEFGYFPYQDNFNYQKVIPATLSYPYHQIVDPFKNTFTTAIDFDLSGSSSISPGDTNVYTISQKGRYKYPITYNIYVLFEDLDELSGIDITKPNSVIVSAGNVGTTFTLELANYVTNPYKRSFTVVVVSKFARKNVYVEINDSRTLALTPITSISGYVDGYLTSQSTVSGTLPNLANTHNGTTSATRKSSNSYGYIYPLTDTADAITIPEITGIKTIVFLYRELVNTPSRSYIGHTDYYTLNGGTTYELVGARQLITNDFIQAINLEYRASRVEISGNDSTFIVFDDNLNKLYLYEKDLTGAWKSTPSEIVLDLNDTNLLQEAALSITNDGTIFALGMKNGNDGEGVVQIWRKTGDTWTKDLHLGSPVPAPYQGGFGHSVSLSEDGLTLFVGEIGSNAVYVFEKSTLWSAIPTETFLGDLRFGFSIDTNEDGTLLVVTSVDANSLDGETHIYRKTTGWAEEEVLNYGSICRLNEITEKLLISNYLQSEVRLYEKITGTWTLITTLTSATPNFGYSIGLSQSSNICIGSPDESKLYLYKESDTWTVPLQFSNENETYGYTMSVNNSTIVVSNYANVVELITNDPAAVPQNVIAVRQKNMPALLSDVIDNTDIQILSFRLNTPLTINRIGVSKIDTGLNGIFAGVLFFNRVLATSELESIETSLSRYLSLYSYSW